MKEIKAVIRPNKLTALREALIVLPEFPGMTVSRVEGCSAPSRHVTHHSIKEELTDFSPKIRIEIIAPDEAVPAIYGAISKVAQTGHFGDGLVWVCDVEKATFIFKTVE